MPLTWNAIMDANLSSTIRHLAVFAVALSLAACQGEGTEKAVAIAAPSAATAVAPETPFAGQADGMADAEVDGDAALYGPWAEVLDRYVDDEGLINYEGLAGAGRDDLEAFMSNLATADPDGMVEPEQIAFWINAYNATVIYQVVERYPIDSVRDVGSLFGLVGGFFKQDYRIAGRDLSLDDIEHEILRPTYNDARIHWTLVCGAFGCPRLLRRPYVGADLDALLNEQSFEFMTNPRALQVGDDGRTLYVSSYFDWYGGDFEAESGNIVDYILRYAPDDSADWIRANRDSLRTSFMDYDWTLNEQSRGPRSRRPVVAGN